jgi:hypothetical protein
MPEGDKLVAYRNRLEKIAKLGGPEREIVLRKADVKKAERASGGPKETKIGEVLQKAQTDGITVPEIHALTGWKKIGVSSPPRSAPASP